MTTPDKRRRILIVVSNIDRVVAFELLCEMIDPVHFSLEFVLLNPGTSYLEEYLRRKGVPVTFLKLRGRLDYFSALPRLLWKLLLSRPDVVNSHLIDASLLALPAAWIAGIKSRIWTRHHSTFHHQYAPRWVAVDRFLTALSTKVIAVSPLVKRIMLHREGAPEEKVTVVEHGFDLAQFQNVAAERVAAVREKYDLQVNQPVIGVVSRFIKWKGIQFIIPAFRQFLKAHPRAVLCLANASGADENLIGSMLEGIPAANLRKIVFEPDHYALFRTFDFFIHAPVNEHCEAFGQVYVEALASGIPSIFTLSGIGADLVENGVNALSVRHEDSAAIQAALEELSSGKVDLDKLRARAIASVQRFGIREMIKKLERAYSD